jgi:hypothetical protein
MYNALEEMIRLDPTQWYMFRSFWPDEDAKSSDTTTQITDNPISSSMRENH